MSLSLSGDSCNLGNASHRTIAELSHVGEKRSGDGTSPILVDHRT